MSIQAARNMNYSNSKPSNSSQTMSNRFAALAVDDEPAAAPTAAQQPQRAPRAYVPPNLRRNQAPTHQAPTTQSRLAAPPKVSAESEFPSLGARHTPAASKPAAGAGWASKARDWANYDETAEAVERERKRKEQEKASMITLSRPAFRAPPRPILSPGTSEFHNTNNIRYPRYPLQSTNEEDNDEVDAAEAYVGGYDQSRYSADYAEPADDEDEGEYNDGRYTPPYPPYPY
jgi:hypothetical protein